MKYFFSILTILGIFFVSLHTAIALGPEFPMIDPGPGGGGKSPVRIFIESFINGKGAKITYPDVIITPYIYPTPTYPPGTTPPITPMITNPPSLTGEGQYADEVVRYTQQHCGGVITRSNYACVDKLAPIMNEGARQELKNSAAAYTYAQCVAGARSMARARNRPYNGYGNAIQHAAGNKDPNYTYYPRAQANCNNLVPGSLFIQNIGAYGHIGYITDVQGCTNNVGTPRSITAFEVNWGPGTVKHGRIIPLSEVYGWQKPNSL